MTTCGTGIVVCIDEVALANFPGTPETTVDLRQYIEVAASRIPGARLEVVGSGLRLMNWWGIALKAAGVHDRNTAEPGHPRLRKEKKN